MNQCIVLNDCQYPFEVHDIQKLYWEYVTIIVRATEVPAVTSTSRTIVGLSAARCATKADSRVVVGGRPFKIGLRALYESPSQLNRYN